jgi:hypothetical protein
MKKEMMKPKYVVVAFLLFLNFVGYYREGYFSEASLLFNGFYFATLLGSAFVLCNLELSHLFIFSFLGVVLGFCAEYLNTEALNWIYFTGAQPPFFVPLGWVSLLALIFYGSRFLEKNINWRIPAVVPPLVCFVLFFVLAYREGNIQGETIGLYLFMAVVGVYAARTGEAGWSAALLVMGIVVGSISEALGASCGLWTFRSGQLLPLPMVVTWSARAFCVSGLLNLLGLQSKKVVKTYTEMRRAEEEKKKA